MSILTTLAQAASGFDVERATQAYLHLLQGPPARALTRISRAVTG